MKSRVPDQKGTCQACYIVEIYHFGPEPSNDTVVEFQTRLRVYWPWGADLYIY